MTRTAVAAHLRARTQAIADAWAARVTAELPELARLSRASLVDHLPEVIDGLAAWLEGDTPAARQAFETLAEGHAVQRLGYGVDLRTLSREYALLRAVLLDDVLGVPLGDETRGVIMRLDEALDEALFESIRRYADARDRMRDRFVGILAHDLRNPLSSILMQASALALASNGEPRIADTALQISRSASRMGRLINDVLDLARGQLDLGIPIALTGNDLGKLAQVVVDELRAAHPGRDLDLTCVGDLRGVFDRDRVIQALSNLVGNAVEHGADPIRISVIEIDERRAIETAVTSFGAPIPDDKLRTLFDPFRVTRSAGGRQGLGLYIVAQIALAHGATTHVTSSSEQGTTFSIRWPRARPEDAPVAART